MSPIRIGGPLPSAENILRARLPRLTPLALVLGALLHSGASHAQTIAIPSNQTGAYTNNVTGIAGTPGDGSDSSPGAGGQAPALSGLSVQQNSGTELNVTGPSPTVDISLTGGVGGTGHDASSGNYDPNIIAGTGGTGGSLGDLQFTTQYYTNIYATTNGPAAAAIQSTGGAGGYAGSYRGNLGVSGRAGDGGNGGDVTLNLQGSIIATPQSAGNTPAATGLLVTSTGGAGAGFNPDNANAGTANQTTLNAHGQSGGAGGDAGDINLTATTANFGGGSGIVMLSQGGAGSQGVQAYASGGHASGGGGGNGGNGGSVTANITGSATEGTWLINATGSPVAGQGNAITLPNGSAETSFTSAGVVAQSFGGLGGLGGQADGTSAAAGVGGNAGSGNTVNLTVGEISVTTQGYTTPGLLAQSIGGSGGSGANAGSVFSAKAGRGAPGGDGAAVTVQTYSNPSTTSTYGQMLISTTGDDSSGIVAQSIGGGGGAGGDVSTGSVLGGFAVGGNGESGGNAGVVTVDNGDFKDANGNLLPGAIIKTTGDRADGISAISIGGGGGSGGNATTSVLGPFAMTIGGTGGTGGSAGTETNTQVTADNNGLIQTFGQHAIGMQAVAVGGGGGNGGSASSAEIGGQLDVTLAVGGKGGTGGTAGDVHATNDGQIQTQNTDAYGMQVLSVGGGGGNGGASKAAALQLMNSGEVPSLDFNLSVGGNGGSGGNAGDVYGTNNFAITTNGAGSYGMLVQSVGGGGGDGGDSSSYQLSTKGSNVNINLAIGGQGAAGGTGGFANGSNNGIIWTMDRDSDGMFVQSVGGGGGSGGVGSADTSQYQDNGGKSGQFNLGIGGSGGTGNIGGAVIVDNNASGTIMTLGDDSRGIFAQSVGGGGGKGAGAISNGSTGTIQTKIAIGGAGGSGNNGGLVQVENDGNIVTGGGDSAGIYAQSVGGGGGDGGNAGTAGNTAPQKLLFNYLKQADPGLVTTYNNDTAGFLPSAGDAFSKGVTNAVNLVKGYYNENNPDAPLPPAGAGDGIFNLTLNVGGGFAGKAGNGGAGLFVDVINTGAIQTLGPLSDGIYAESIGGGGGDGGAVTASNNSSQNPQNVNATIAMGGRGGSGGQGGIVMVTNTGSIATGGSASMGILALSVGGGGGTGGYTATKPSNTKMQTVDVQLGGDAGTEGNGNTVQVLDTAQNGGTGGLSAAAPSPTVTTSGTYAAGIAALSIGGGGGVVTLLSSLPNAATGGAVSTGGLQMSGFQMAGLDATAVCGTTAATCGNGGNVTVDAPTVQTSGQDSAGVVAQSIGGGGGWVLGAATGGAGYFNQVNGLSGNGQTVTVNAAGNVSTTGAGAYGVIAQSIGGGGLLAGDLSSASASVASSIGVFDDQTKSNGIGSIGNGGNVNVTVNANSTISTTGANAVGIFAQSVGGGGGLVASDGLAYMGTAGGKGSWGAVNVQVNGSVATTGSNAAAIVVDAEGTSASTNGVLVNVGSTGNVSSQSGNAIVIDSDATSNVVTNSGQIAFNGTGLGYAIDAIKNPVDVTNSGTVIGAIKLGTGTFTNNTGSVWQPAMAFNFASAVQNSGNIWLGVGINPKNVVPFTPNTLLNGNLTSTGTIESNIDFANSQFSTLDVNGTAHVGGTVLINPLTMQPGTVQIISATNGLTLASGLSVVDAPNYLYTYSYTNQANTLSVTPQLNALAMAQVGSFSRNAQQLAGNLDANFAAGDKALWPIYTALANVQNATQYRGVLQGLSAESLQMVGVARTTASESFVNRMNACPDNGDAAMDMHQRDCVWGRVSDQASTGDGSDGDSYHLNEHVVQMGGQHEFADGWWVGGSMAYNNGSESASSGVGGVTDHGFSVGAVVKREWGPWLFTGAIDVGQGSYDSNRNLQLTDQRVQATGSFDANNIGMHSRIAYLFSGANWYVKPYVDLHAVNVHTDSFEETNVGAIGFKVGAGNGTVFSATPMIEAGGRINFSNGAELRPSIGVGEAIYSGNHWDTNLQLIGGASNVSPFNSEFNAPDHMNQYNAGLDLKINAHSELRLDYTGQFGNGYRMNEGSLRYTYFF